MIRKIPVAAMAALITFSTVSAMAADQYPTPQVPTNQGLFVIGSLGGGLTYWNNLNGTEYSTALMGAPGTTNFTGVTNNFNSVGSSSGFIWGASGGYQFNQYFGAQVDYVHFRGTAVTDSRYTYTAGTLTNTAANNSYTVSEYGIGIFFRASVPLLNSGLEFYTKIGAGFLKAKGTGAIGSIGNWGPAFGVGASYMFGNGLTLGASWTRYSGNSKLGSTTFIPNADAIMANIGYFFQV